MARGIAWLVMGLFLVGCHLAFPHGLAGDSSIGNRDAGRDRDGTGPSFDRMDPRVDSATPGFDQPAPMGDQSTPTFDQPIPKLDQAKPNPDQPKPKPDQAKPKLDQPKPKLDTKFMHNDLIVFPADAGCPTCISPSVSCDCPCECFPKNTYCMDIVCKS